jgi:hypothetical protein
VRNALGLTNGQKLLLKRKVMSNSTSNSVNIVLQLPNGERLSNNFETQTSLYEILLYFETSKALKLINVGDKMIPVINFINRDISTLELLKSTNLIQ